MEKMRKTRARDLVLNILDSQISPITAEEIFEKITDDTIDLSTIYRTLKLFTDNNMAKKEILNDGKSYYSIMKNEHMHILECVKCHEKIFLNECPFHNINKEIKKNTGFEINDQNVVLYGICKNCNQN